jgi:hypothetical protein
LPADVILKTASVVGFGPGGVTFALPSVVSASSLMHSVHVVETFVTPAGGAHDTLPESSSIDVRARQ